MDPRAILDAIGALEDDEIDLADAALHLARIDAPEADWQAARTHLSTLARAAVEAHADLHDHTPRALAEALRSVLVQQFRYRGDTETYDDLANFNLIHVIERRRGGPVALGILWLHAATAANWPAHGVNLPGHFLIALGNTETEFLLLDPFSGGKTFDKRTALRMWRMAAKAGSATATDLRAPMTRRSILIRLQNNIRTRRLAANNPAGALACIEDMLRLAPTAALLWRDAAKLQEQLGHYAAALTACERFLELAPPGYATTEITTIMDTLRARLN